MSADDLLASLHEILNRHESSAAKDRAILPNPPFFVGGEGARIWDTAGREYIDLCSGAGVNSSGYGNKAVREAAVAQLSAGLNHVGAMFVSPPKATLIEAITSVMPSALTRVHLTVTGGEAIEAALKIARIRTGRHNMIAFWGAYHGRPQGALGLTAHRASRDPILPLSIGSAHFPYPYPYRNPWGFDPTDADRICEMTLNYLDAALESPASGLSPTAAVVVEPIQGVGGVVIPPAGFLSGLREICSRHDLLLIIDEIFCGFGKTGAWFGFERDGVVPDLVVISKGFTGGFPVSAVVGTEEIMTSIPQGVQSTTFEGNPVISAAAAANIEYLASIDAPARARELHGYIERALSEITAGCVGEVRGMGAMWGLEIVHPGSTAPDSHRAKQVQADSLRNGVLTYLGGYYGNVVGLIPPLVASRDDIDEGVSRVSAAIVNNAE
ncbi:MAG: aspartate aminotransferase family protein [Chloroflexota bacterium]